MLWENLTAVGVAFIAGIGVAAFNKYVLNTRLICNCRDSLFKSCCCNRNNVAEPDLEYPNNTPNPSPTVSSLDGSQPSRIIRFRSAISNNN